MACRTSLSVSSLLVPIGAIASLAAGSAYAATPTFYDDQTAFQTDITYSVTDDYSNPAYMFIQSDAAMSDVLGQTDYHSTGFMDLNIVSGGTYCSGCNGSFELSFQTTTLGTAEGVNGVGLTILSNDMMMPYFAYITYADGTTEDLQMGFGGFWGVSAPERIERIHFGLSGGVSTTNGYFQIDNLIVGDYIDTTPCGDGDATPDEECDDMGESATCDVNCTLALCGDSTFNPTSGELCDSGGIATPTCNPDCTLPVCGDTIVNPIAGEDCDDGGETAACDIDCTLASCGDDTVNLTAGETCDDGGQSPTCDGDCTAVVCGDGVENNLAGEYCDDGNNDDGDGCSATCVTEEGPGTSTEEGGSSESDSGTSEGTTDTGDESSDSGEGETAADTSAGDTAADTTDGEESDSGSASMSATDSDSMTGLVTDSNGEDSSSSGADADDDDAGGCGCTTPTNDRGTAWLALAMLGLGALKPRRR